MDYHQTHVWKMNHCFDFLHLSICSVFDGKRVFSQFELWEVTFLDQLMDNGNRSSVGELLYV